MSEEKKHRSLSKRFQDDFRITGAKPIFGDSHYVIKRIIWVLVVLSSCGYMGRQVYVRVMYYLSNPKKVNIDLEYKRPLPFPAVTICNNNRFRLSASYKYGTLPQYADYPFRLSDVSVFRYTTMMIETIDKLRLTAGPDSEEGKKIIEKYREVNSGLVHEQIDWAHFYNFMSHQKKDMVKECYLRGAMCDLDKDFSAVATDLGVCYTFNGNKTDPELIYSEGATGGLVLKLNTEQYEYTTGVKTSAGFTVLLHDPDAPPRFMLSSGIPISTGTQTSLVVSMVQHNASKGLDIECSEDTLMQQCLIDCNTNFLVEKCGCRDYLMSGTANVSLCEPMETIQCIFPWFERLPALDNYTDWCPCSPKCERTEFRSGVFRAPLSNHEAWKTAVTEYPWGSRARERVKATARIKDYAFIFHRNISLTENIVSLGRKVEYIYGNVEQALKCTHKVLNLLQEAEPFFTSASLNLRQSLDFVSGNVTEQLGDIGNTRSWTKETYFFNFTEESGEDFISRITHDLLRKKNLFLDWIHSYKSQIIALTERPVQDILFEFIEDWNEESDNGEGSADYYATQALQEWATCIIAPLSTAVGTFPNVLQSYEHIKGIINSDPTLSEIPWDGDTYDADFVRDNFVELHVYYKDMSVTKVHQQPDDDFAKLIADLGGYLGLFLGGSLLTIFELIDIIAVYIASFSKQMCSKDSRPKK